uniref:Uncharacterized protein n=1 Tax=Anguilla anguilla TaxID=7936 RepID=A0A0E9VCM3_ANGAN
MNYKILKAIVIAFRTDSGLSDIRDAATLIVTYFVPNF